jgi:anaerobic magnesium-protoporphyrin IX monomethyl ester cyclase
MENKLECLLINPADDFSRYPYLGLCYLAGSLIKRNISVQILDSSALGLTNESIINHILDCRPSIIGISIMSMSLPLCYTLIKLIQNKYPEGILVVGGAHINADPEIIKDMDVRYGFHGECETTFVDFCEALIVGKDPKNIPGLLFNHGGEVRKNPPAKIDDINELAMPAYELLPLDKYYSPSTSRRTISFITSRGCPYNCVYCSKLSQIKYRALTPENVVNQIEILVKHFGIQWIEFVDEIFTLSKGRTIDICEKIIANNLDFNWGCGTRADRIDEELLKIMKKAGCQKIGFGIESGVERVRYNDHKKISNSQIIEAINLCRKYKITSICSFIFGHPTETELEMKETLNFSIKLKSDFNYYFKMMPIPNSELYEIAKNTNKIPADVWRSYMLGEISHPVFYPETIDKESMDKIYRWAWIRFYLSGRNIIQKFRVILSPRMFIRSLKAFLILVSGKKYR